MYDSWSHQIADYEANMPCPNYADGVALQIDGQIEAVDLFDNPQTFRQLWPRLLRSYSVGALREAKNGKRKQEVEEFLARAMASEVDSFESIGVGTTARITDGEISGAALCCQDHTVHFSLFATR